MICKCGGTINAVRIQSKKADLVLVQKRCIACGRVDGDKLYVLSSNEFLGRGIAARQVYDVATLNEAALGDDIW